MASIALLQARLASLERSRRRERLAAALLALGWLVFGLAAFAPPARTLLDSQPQQVPEELVTQRLVLTGSVESSGVVLVAGPEGSLVVLTPEGVEIARIGGPAARRIGH